MVNCALCKHWRQDVDYQDVGECLRITKDGFTEEDFSNSKELISITNPCSTVQTKADFGCVLGVGHGPTNRGQSNS